MNNVSPSLQKAFYPLRVAAMAFVCLIASTNAHLDAAQPLVPNPVPVANAHPSDPLHVLSAKDAELYRAAFDAQAENKEQKADIALAQIKDRRLVGHVLADRYTRRPLTLPEAKQWLATYAHLPQATTIYAAARRLKGFSAASIPRPAAGTVPLKGGAGIGGGLQAISGFRNQTETTHDSRVAATLFYQGDTDRAIPLARKEAKAGVPLGLWIDGLAAWKTHDFTGATRSFASLAQAQGLSIGDKAAASYWAYRAAKKMGDSPQARHWLVEAAKYPSSFYGYLAASTTGGSVIHSWKMPELTEKNIALLSQNQTGWQALALMQVGQMEMAEDALRRLKATSSSMQNAVLALAEKARMPSLTMQLGGKTTNEKGQTYQAALYPLPPWQPVGGFEVDRALIFALARHESQFDPDAVSGSGACGLMQIMPSTARGMNGIAQTGKGCPAPLFDPVTNMELGQRYVRTLSEQPMIGDNLLLLLAAYNGGPGNLSRWLDGEDRTDPLLFIESVPLRETHDYVQQVMLQYWMYRARLSQPENSAAQLARGEWPRYALRDSGVRHADTAATSVLKVASAN